MLPHSPQAASLQSHQALLCLLMGQGRGQGLHLPPPWPLHSPLLVLAQGECLSSLSAVSVTALLALLRHLHLLCYHKVLASCCEAKPDLASTIQHISTAVTSEIIPGIVFVFV